MNDNINIDNIVFHYAKLYENFIIDWHSKNNQYNQQYLKKLTEIDNDFKICIKKLPNKEALLEKTLEFFSVRNYEVNIHIFRYWNWIAVMNPSVLFIPPLVELLKQIASPPFLAIVIDTLSWMPQKSLKPIIPELIKQIKAENHNWSVATINAIIDIIADTEEPNNSNFVLSEGIYSSNRNIKERCKYWADIYADND